MRNKVLAPLALLGGTVDRVLFLNDVVLCEADALELFLMHEVRFRENFRS